jgi:hypothetical protein
MHIREEPLVEIFLLPCLLKDCASREHQRVEPPTEDVPVHVEEKLMFVDFIKWISVLVYPEVLFHFLALVLITLIHRRKSDSVQIFISLELCAEARIYEPIHGSHKSLAVIDVPIVLGICKTARGPTGPIQIVVFAVPRWIFTLIVFAIQETLDIENIWICQIT